MSRRPPPPVPTGVNAPQPGSTAQPSRLTAAPQRSDPAGGQSAAAPPVPKGVNAPQPGAIVQPSRLAAAPQRPGSTGGRPAAAPPVPRGVNAPQPIGTAQARLAAPDRPAGRAGPVAQPAAHSYTFGFSESEMDTGQWAKSGQSTFNSVMYHMGDDIVPLGLSKSNQSVTHGAEHAEDVALRVIGANLSMFSTLRRNHIIINLSKSPCTSTARPDPLGPPGTMLPTTSGKLVGCTEELLNFVNTGLNDGLGNHYDFQLTIICRGLYAPGGTNAAVRASQAAVDALNADANIVVTGDERVGRQTRYGVA